MPTPAATSAVELTWDQVPAWRVRRHHLAERAADPVAVVGKLGGVQAQVLQSSKQGGRIRSHASPAVVDRLLWTDRRLVKTWAMRGMLHLPPGDEIGLWVAVLRRRQRRITAGWEKYHGVTAAEQAAITEAVPTVLDRESRGALRRCELPLTLTVSGEAADGPALTGVRSVEDVAAVSRSIAGTHRLDDGCKAPQASGRQLALARLRNWAR